MAFINRLTRLLRADLHALLDQLEAPDLVLAQAVREMEQVLDRERRALVRLEREIARLRGREVELQRLLEQTGEALDDCLAAGQDALARPVIRRRLEVERQVATLNRHQAALESERETLERRIAEQGERLADLRARAVFHEEERESDARGWAESWSHAEPGVRDADVDVALLRAKRWRERTS